MTDQDNSQELLDTNNVTMSPIAPVLELQEVQCPNIGTINCYVQYPNRRRHTAYEAKKGPRSFSEVVVLTVHDLGCDHTMYVDFVERPSMKQIRDRTVWLHVIIPGQGKDAPDLPSDYQFPTMQQIGEDLIHVLDQLKIKEVVCFGEGAGANILARFAMAHIERVLGVVLLHCTGTTAGFLEAVKDKVIGWKLDHAGMNPTAEAYLVLHRFGIFGKAEDQQELKNAIENYQELLRTKTNPKNLKKFVETFLRRTNIAESSKISKLKCPVLLMTGQKSVFTNTTHTLHQSIVKTCQDKAKVEFIEVAGTANLLEGRPEKVAECLQYFMQGLGLVSSVPMHHVTRPPRLRSLSMEEYDKPLRNRSMSGGSGTGSPLSSSPPNV